MPRPVCLQADEELLLLEGIEIYGLGNWPKVAGERECHHLLPAAAYCLLLLLSVTTHMQCTLVLDASHRALRHSFCSIDISSLPPCSLDWQSMWERAWRSAGATT
mgnify:CR=1 FL=1